MLLLLLLLLDLLLALLHILHNLLWSARRRARSEHLAYVWWGLVFRIVILVV